MNDVKKLITGRVLYGFMLVMRLIVYVTPLFFVDMIGANIGSFFFAISSRYRKKATLQMSKICGISRFRAFWRTYRVFVHFGIQYIETVKFNYLSEKEFTERYIVRGEKIINRTLNRGTGAILVSAHFGNWETLFSALPRAGYKTAIIYQKLFDADIDRLVGSWRSRFGAVLIESRDAIRKVRRFIEDKGLVIILFDQKVADFSGMKTSFLGHEAQSPFLPIQFAIRMNIPIIPVFLVRRNGVHEVIIEEPVVPLSTLPEDCAVTDTLRDINTRIERWITKYPEQWIWSYNKWNNLQ